MKHSAFRHITLWAFFFAIAMLPAFGCRSLLATAVLLTNGTDVAPEFGDLKGKKVAVVCRPVVNLQYRDTNVARDLAQQLSSLLQARVSKIQVIEQRKVTKWADENTWEEYPEVGKALKADMVVGVDLESFSLYQGQTVYQGKASATIRVYDCRHGNKLVFEKPLPPSCYPPNSVVPASDRPENAFRHQYLGVLADQIGRYFYPHDPNADLAQDAAALR
jgi:uncharacterized protein YbjQ (UPF0145 family)